MLDVALLRNEPSRLAAAFAHRGVGVDLDALADLDRRRREVRAGAEELRAEQKRVGKEIGALEGEAREEAIARTGALSEQYKEALASADALDAEFEELWVPLPNLVHEAVPKGETEEDAAVLSQWGEPPEFDFDFKDHQELGEQLGVVDKERAAKVSGSRFFYLKGELAMLEFALARWAIDVLVGEGFTPVVPPVLVREHALFGTGFFPEAREQVYEIPEDDLFLVGTSEVALAAMHADEILDGDDLPMRYAGFSSCFRREAGSYGKDTRGMFRVHQFDKVEMFSFCHPDRSWDEHEYLLSIEERVIQALGLPYRVTDVASGDLGASAARKYDIESWFPGQGAYRELTSCSNTTDYQARRLKIRFRGEGGNRFVHTLNGTVVTNSRTLPMIMEIHQQADGSIVVPEVLRPHAGFDRIGPAA